MQRALSSHIILENKTNIFQTKCDENQKQQITLKVLKPQRAHNVISLKSSYKQKLLKKTY